MVRVLQFSIAVLALPGCANLERQASYDKNINKFGAFSMTVDDVAEEIDLVSVISRGRNQCVVTSDQPDKSSHDKRIQECAKMIDQELQNADTRLLALAALKLEPDQARMERNSIQERLLLASDHRCGRYKSMLQEKYSNANFWSGLLTTALGTAGAIATASQDSRNLAGLAGVTSGFRAEYNQSFFGNLLAHVVADGIDSRRRATYVQIIERGQHQPYALYPLSQAIKDAVRYHSQCSLISGLAEASDAIRTVNDPGLAASTRIIAQVKLAKLVESAQSATEIQKAVEDYGKVASGKWMAGVPSQIANAGTTATSRDTYVSEYEQAVVGYRVAKGRVIAAAKKPENVLDTTKFEGNLKPVDDIFDSAGQCSMMFEARKKAVNDALVAQSIAGEDERPAKLASSRAADLEFAAFSARVSKALASKVGEINALAGNIETHLRAKVTKETAAAALASAKAEAAKVPKPAGADDAVTRAQADVVAAGDVFSKVTSKAGLEAALNTFSMAPPKCGG
jgi:hypothetical protein